jgi:uncharacterized membrane protein YkvA (DUF1232 family)
MMNKPDEESVSPKYSEIVKEGAENVTEKDIEKVIDKSEEIKKKFKIRGPLSRFMEDARLLIAAVRDYRSGAYRKFPYAIIAAAVFALLYVFNPFDLMPDILPLIGQLDDVAVMGACLMLVEQDLLKYKVWKEGQA